MKQWEINLSKKTGRQPTFTDQNPMFQIDTYLTLTGLEWGILSNGRFWRLVHKDSSRTLETYFEIDLLGALQQPDATKATAVAAYFWLFFRQAAFRSDEHGRIFLHDALDQSRAYALSLEADLRDNAYRALEQLIIGFFAANPDLDPADATQRERVYGNSLYLLYRLLFLFYGESRALLPMTDPTYKNEYSLQQLARGIDSRRNELDSLPTTGRRTWNRLAELFRLISGVDPQLNADLGVPRYNGGLFDPQQHPFLENYVVGEQALARAIDYLAYRRVREDGRFRGYQMVDYRTLDVRQLGSIYEGLLEYKVAVAAEEMVTVRKGGVETWLPAAERGRAKALDRRQPGELYLATDKGERKATGSYYTPDYIVEYIVANTLGPLVAEARERVKAQVRETGSLDAAARQQQSADRFVQEILRLNVLDPAMGSGHFLVEATNYLARALATDEYVQAAPSPKIGPFSENGPISDATEETDLLYWKRRVVEACIYGVDKNPMAVELAKLSLWLKTAAADKPLSFLDHHLQHGDSLIGAWLDDLQSAPGARPQGFSGQSSGDASGSKPLGSPEQQPLFDESAFTRDAGLAVKGVMTIERLPTLDIGDVHAKEAAWRDVRRTHVARWRRLADLWVSHFFGNRMTPEEYRALAARLQQPHFPGNSEFPGKSQAEGKSLMTEAQAAQFLDHPALAENDYFHWELAFPEVFFDEYGRSLGAAAGFDAVIGNPPYVRQEEMAAIKPFLPHAYKPVYKGTADLYVYFLNGGVNWLRAGGFLSYIVSNKWLRVGYGDGLRAFLAQESLVKGIVDFGHAPIFADADTFPCILVLRKPENGQEVESNKTEICIFPREELENVDVTQFVNANSFSISSKRFSDDPWSLEPEIVENLMEKVRQRGVALSEFIGQKPYYGIKTGFNQAFLIDNDTKEKLIRDDPGSAKIIHPYLRGQDIKRWSPEWMDLWMILLKSSENYQWPWSEAEDEAENIFAQTYPSIYEHLITHVDRLRKRQDQGRFWWELRSCTYYEVFEKPTIIHTDITWRPQFALSPKSIYLLNTAYLWPTDDLYLLGVVNSPLLWSFMWRNATHGKDEALRLIYSFVENLPIAVPSNNIRSEVETAVTETIALTKKHRTLIKEMLDWLHVEFGIDKPGQKLESFATLSGDDFMKEVKKRRSRSSSRLTPAEVRLLKTTHEKYGRDVRQLETTINQLETKLSDLVNQAYGLTDDEIAWLWKTAPPRMPIALSDHYQKSS